MNSTDINERAIGLEAINYLKNVDNEAFEDHVHHDEIIKEVFFIVIIQI